VEVVHERRVVLVRVLRPNARLPTYRRAVRDRRLEESVNRFTSGGIERDMRRDGHGRALRDGEVVQTVRAVADAILLHVELLEPKRSQRCRLQAPRCRQVLDDEEHVIDDDQPRGHRLTVHAGRRLRGATVSADASDIDRIEAIDPGIG